MTKWGQGAAPPCNGLAGSVYIPFFPFSFSNLRTKNVFLTSLMKAKKQKRNSFFVRKFEKRKGIRYPFFVCKFENEIGKNGIYTDPVNLFLT